MRHSFISYRVAHVQDVAKVSLEAGNSPQMIQQHYKELVRPKEAKEWFAITPEQVEAVKAATKPQADKVVELARVAAVAA